MSFDRENEVIQIRHRLRAIATLGSPHADAMTALDRFQDLSAELGDPDLSYELARWRIQFDHMDLM